MRDRGPNKRDPGVFTGLVDGKKFPLDDDAAEATVVTGYPYRGVVLVSQAVFQELNDIPAESAWGWIEEFQDDPRWIRWDL